MNARSRLLGESKVIEELEGHAHTDGDQARGKEEEEAVGGRLLMDQLSVSQLFKTSSDELIQC